MEPLRLLIVADPVVPVPPTGYGGAERMIADVVVGMRERGHRITLMAGQTSITGIRFIPFTDARTKPRPLRGLAKALFWIKLAREVRRHDVVQSVARLDYMTPALRSKLPKVLQFQHPIVPEQLHQVRSRQRGPVAIVPAGHNQMASVRDDGIWEPIYNAIPVGTFDLRAQPDDPPYLLFLGRITRTKGVHTAIRVARRAGMPLAIAGNIGSGPDDRGYFADEVVPHVDGTSVRYIGEVDHAAKNELLGGATALLFPIEWDEPMGMVQLEALATGTPVIASARGESPRLISDGKTGFVCATEDEMVRAVGKIGSIDRTVVRRVAEERFDVPHMLDELEALYARLLRSSG